MLEVQCERCKRHGRLKMAGLLEKYGGVIALPDLRLTVELANDTDSERTIAAGGAFVAGLDHSRAILAALGVGAPIPRLGLSL